MSNLFFCFFLKHLKPSYIDNLSFFGLCVLSLLLLLFSVALMCVCMGDGGYICDDDFILGLGRVGFVGSF